MRVKVLSQRQIKLIERAHHTTELRAPKHKPTHTALVLLEGRGGVTALQQADCTAPCTRRLQKRWTQSRGMIGGRAGAEKGEEEKEVA